MIELITSFLMGVVIIIFTFLCLLIINLIENSRFVTCILGKIERSRHKRRKFFDLKLFKILKTVIPILVVVMFFTALGWVLLYGSK